MRIWHAPAQIHTGKMTTNSFLGADVDLWDLAQRTKNFSGAEIEGLVRMRMRPGSPPMARLRWWEQTTLQRVADTRQACNKRAACDAVSPWMRERGQAGSVDVHAIQHYDECMLHCHATGEERDVLGAEPAGGRLRPVQTHRRGQFEGALPRWCI